MKPGGGRGGARGGRAPPGRGGGGGRSAGAPKGHGGGGGGGGSGRSGHGPARKEPTLKNQIRSVERLLSRVRPEGESPVG
jgi:hypothetical protein